ncbi:MAG: glucose-6-phosphate 1-dehydrogenase [Candidatus Peregrinibacteria bacterium Greene1014_49]|nr:MAG: glucose-6-phosphate 1-dehydrogenase [Candidatus Peregrinibacteria bacterium Greene1014_49]
MALQETPSGLKANRSFSLVIFGASGHLARIKIYPALYVLALKKRLPKDYAIFGFARSAMDDKSFRALVESSIRESMLEVTEWALKDLLEHVHYQQGQYDAVKDFKALAKRMETMEKTWKSPVRLAYFSIPPTVFHDVLDNICKGGIHHRKNQDDFRCIIEKPVGSNLESFEKVKAALTTCFGEKEIYLLDHYLGKEAVRNIYYLRYANPILERILKHTLIHHVEVTAMESGGLEGRAGYFDAVGTLRDMVQSHLLQICALLTMRLQEDTSVQAARMHALDQLYLPHAVSLDDIVVQGQYAAGTIDGERFPGYRDEEEVSKSSRTSTYTALRLMSRSSRWEGVPFLLRTGKRLSRKETRISIAFQEPQKIGKGATPNRLDIILQGEAGMRLHLQTKLGGTEPEFRPLIMTDPLVCMGDCLPEHGLLLLEAIIGKQQWFLSFDEVRTAWRIIDPLQQHLDKKATKLPLYKAGSNGPEEADGWMEKQGVKWF